jgi:hypothetical protein
MFSMMYSTMMPRPRMLPRKLATDAMTIELAAERGDWETVNDAHDRLIGLYEEYRATYTNLLLQGAHRPAKEEPRSEGVESADPSRQEKAETYSGLSDSMSC